MPLILVWIIAARYAGWRLLSGIEAMNGIMQAGLTAAMLFTVVERI